MLPWGRLGLETACLATEGREAGLPRLIRKVGLFFPSYQV